MSWTEAAKEKGGSRWVGGCDEKGEADSVLGWRAEGEDRSTFLIG